MVQNSWKKVSFWVTSRGLRALQRNRGCTRIRWTQFRRKMSLHPLLHNVVKLRLSVLRIHKRVCSVTVVVRFFYSIFFRARAALKIGYIGTFKNFKFLFNLYVKEYSLLNFFVCIWSHILDFYNVMPSCVDFSSI